jgi:hypothetical protein
MYIPFKSAHPRHTIKNYLLGELKRYVRINTEELNFLKIKTSFSLDYVTAVSKKRSYHVGFPKLDIHSEPSISALTRETFVISRVREKQGQILCSSKFQRIF